MSGVTEILHAIEAGEPQAAGQLLPLVYDELRKLAAQKLAGEKPGQTLDATALVHEAYVRLVGPAASGGQAGAGFAGRRHFFAAAAEAMRHILIDSARRKRRRKRGGDFRRRDLDVEGLAAPEDSDELLALDEAIAKLAAADATAAEVVRLRFFAGLPIADVAPMLGISVRTANRAWAYARAWLRDELDRSDGPGPGS